MRVVLSVSIFLCLGLQVLSPSAVLAQSPETQVQVELRALLAAEASSEYLLVGRESIRLHPGLKAFYAGRNFVAAWIADAGTAPLAEQLLDALREVSAEGLCPEDYHVAQITALRQLINASPRHEDLFSSRWLARFDLLLSDAFLWYASDHLQGRMVFDDLRQHTQLDRGGEAVRLLDQAIRQERLTQVLAGLVPSEPGYRQLMQALADYRQLAMLGGWAKIPSGPIVHPNESDARVPQLKARLLQTEALKPFTYASSAVMDREVVRGLRMFQRRHGLVPDGVLGPRTLAELNVPVAERIQQIELNLERWRWLPKNQAKRYIQVNIADFSLQVIENKQVVMRMPVIVGTEYRKTPVFSGEMTYLEFSPYWYVPPTILRKDKLPLIRRNPQWLSKNHFEIVSWSEPQKSIDPETINWKKVTARNFPGALRQKPGPWNALGQVKFMFPNRLSIYLHDTSDRHLFQRRVRLISSGCIRIERPLDLAQYLLEPQGVGCDELLAAVDRNSPLRISLAKPVPVQILYWTAWVDTHGQLQFRNDFYLRDLDMVVALEGGRSEEWKARTDP